MRISSVFCKTVLIGIVVSAHGVSHGQLDSDLTPPQGLVIELTPDVPVSEPSSSKPEVETRSVDETQALAKSTDPRTRLLNSSSRIGYGAATTGGTNYVYVKTYKELQSAIGVDGNYVILDPSLAGKELALADRLYPGNDITLDGSLAPGLTLYPNYDAGFPAGGAIIQNHGAGGNKIFHSFKLDCRRELPYNRDSPSGNVGGLHFREGQNYWINHIEVTRCWDDALLSGSRNNNSSDYITVSNSRIHNTDKAYTLYNIDAVAMGKGHVTAFGNEFSSAGRNPQNRGAEDFHFFNNWVHDWSWMAVASVGTSFVPDGNLLGSRTSDSVMISENNVYEAKNARNDCAERTDPDGIWKGWIYSNGNSEFNGTQICGLKNYVTDNSKGPGRPVIPYEYTLMSTKLVKDYIINNAGPLK